MEGIDGGEGDVAMVAERNCDQRRATCDVDGSKLQQLAVTAQNFVANDR